MDHVTVHVTDLDAGTRFWSALLAALGCRDHDAADSNAACVLDAHGSNLEAVRRGTWGA